MRILLVDDEIEFVSTLTERLNLRGIEADYVTSGNKAVDAVKKEKYCLVVLDMKMAGLGGIETLKKIREDFPEMKFIILTGHGDEGEYFRGKEAGAAYYLIKPLDIEDLIERINQAMRGEADTE